MFDAAPSHINFRRNKYPSDQALSCRSFGLITTFLCFPLSLCPSSACCSLSDRDAFFGGQLATSGFSSQSTEVHRMWIFLSFLLVISFEPYLSRLKKIKFAS